MLNETEREILTYGFLTARDKIDKEFIEYLEYINKHPFVATQQCCIGHCPYVNPDIVPPCNHTKNYGYLLIVATEDFVAFLSEVFEKYHFDWLWKEGSMFSFFGRPPEVMENGSISVCFAWDAKYWPKPAIDICAMTTLYHGDN